MVRFSRYQLVHLCIVALFIFGLLGIEHLTWKECLRLVCIFLGVTFLFLRYRKSLVALDGHQSDGRVVQMASILLVGLLSFVITQFDPATSANSVLASMPYLGFFFWISSVLVAVLGGIFFISGWWQVRFKNLNNLDKVILFGALTLASISLGAQLIIAQKVSATGFVVVIKIISYVVLWFVLTHVYTVSWGNEKEVFGGRNRWGIVFLSCLILFGASTVYGMYRTGRVIYHFKLGQEALQDQHVARALEHYEHVRAWNQYVDLRYVGNMVSVDLAVLYLKTGRADDAQEMMALIAEQHYEDKDMLLKKGEIYRRSEQWGNAINVYNDYLARIKNDTFVLDYLAEAYVNTKNSLALEQLIVSHDYTPRMTIQGYENHIFLGNFYFRRKQFESALKHYFAARDLDMSAYVLYKIGRVYFEQMQYQKSEETLLHATSLMPNFADAFYWLGQCYKMQSQTTRANQMYLKTVEILPHHLDSLLALKNL